MGKLWFGPNLLREPIKPTTEVEAFVRKHFLPHILDARHDQVEAVAP